MKKNICLLLVLLFTLLFTFSAFAATDDINDPLLPTSADTVTEDQYGENEEEFEDEDTPEAPPVVEITDEVLPQTGGIPAEAFYIIGGICIISAILLLARKEKPSTK